MKKITAKAIILALSLSLGTACLTSCLKEAEWVDSIDKSMDFWSSPSLSLYYVNEEQKGLIDMEKPETWPILSDKKLSASELEEARAYAKATAGYGRNGLTYSDGHARLQLDELYNIVYFVPQVKCNNTGKATTYIYFQGSEDALNATFHYTKEDGEWFVEVKSINYNDQEIYKCGVGEIATFIQK